MSTDSIGKIVCTPSSVVAGQSVLVEVYAPDGTPYNNSEKFFISINDIPGSRVYLQFARIGTQTIVVIAAGPHGFEQETITIEVTAGHGFALLNIGRLPHSHYGVAFNFGSATQVDVANRDLIANSLPPALGPIPKIEGASTYALTSQLAAEASARNRGTSALLAYGELSQVPPIRKLPNGSEPPPAYSWDFGDGTELGTNTPYAEHSYERTLDPEREYQQFDVTVYHQRAVRFAATRTVTIYNAYFYSRKYLGVIVPPVDSEAFAPKVKDGYLVTMTVSNRESFPITLTQRRLIPVFADEDRQALPLPVETLRSPITIGSQSSESIQVFASFSQIPDDAVGFTAYYSGQTADGKPIRAGAHFDVSPSDRFSTGLRLGDTPATHVGFSAVEKMLVQAITQAGKSVRGNATLSDIRIAGNHGTANLTDFELARPIISNINHLLSSRRSMDAEKTHPIALRLQTEFNIDLDDIRNFGIPADPLIQEGDECDPDNLPANVPPGFVCQATTEKRMVITPGRFNFARKGDIVLSPGGNGLIGGLLRQVTPPQRYSHSGIMTRNHVQITHCTMSEDRMKAYPVGTDPTTGKPVPIHGFRPDVVKYGWPGVITQTVENSVIGEWFLDPETANLPKDQQKWYQINAFNGQPEGMDLGGAWVIVPPLVIMPDPMFETPEIRQRLQAIADDAAAQTNKGHYRFFCYTDPTITETTTAPAEAGWAAGTFPAVCSSFIWKMMKKHGVQLEGPGATVRDGDLEVIDKEAGAKVGPATPDGLYLYTASQRLIAGNWLHNALYNMAYAEAGGLNEWLTKVAEHISNQILNTFDTDHTQTDDDNTTWQTQRDANAVSPDNLLFWDGPNVSAGSLYGFALPLSYREPRYDTVTIYKWRKVLASGTLSGTVFFNNAPIDRVSVQLYDGMTAFTDANGRYQLLNVPFGPYVAHAEKVQQDGTFLSADPAVTIQGPSTTLDIYLQLPPDMYRTVHINGNIHTHYTRWVGPVKVDDQTGDLPFYRALDVGPFHTHEEMSIEHDVSDAHAILHIVVDWQLDKSVRVNFSFQLHDQSAANSFSVAQDAWGSWWATCSADNDDSRADFTVANDLKQA